MPSLRRLRRKRPLKRPQLTLLRLVSNGRYHHRDPLYSLPRRWITSCDETHGRPSVGFIDLSHPANSLGVPTGTSAFPEDTSKRPTKKSLFPKAGTSFI